MGRSLDSRLAILLRAVSPRGEPDPVEAPDGDGSGRIVLVEDVGRDTLITAARRLAADGLLAVSGTPRAIRGARRLLTAEGLTDGGTFLRNDRALIGASRPGRTLHATQSASSRTRAVALRLAPAALAPQLAVFTRNGAPPPLAWLAPAHEAAALSASHRGTSVAVRVSDPDLFAKWTTERTALERAHANASSFAAGARAAGFDVPESRLVELGEAAALVADARSGGTAAAALRRHPGGLRALADRLTATLEAWNLRSRQVAAFGTTHAARQLNDDLDTVAPLVDADQIATVRRLAEQAAGEPTPVAPAHGDVSMWNVVLGGELTLVDWEAAQPEMLPGFDAEYAVVDATAAAAAYADRVAAFRATNVAEVRARIGATTGLPTSLARIAPVACWAHHAANEHRSSGDDASFVSILRLVLAEACR